MKKDGIPIEDNGENPQAPLPREMIDLEVSLKYVVYAHERMYMHMHVHTKACTCTHSLILILAFPTTKK